VPQPIAAGKRLEGRACPGWRLRHRVSDSEAALDWPALEGYTIGSGGGSPGGDDVSGLAYGPAAVAQ